MIKCVFALLEMLYTKCKCFKTQTYWIDSQRPSKTVAKVSYFFFVLFILYVHWKYCNNTVLNCFVMLKIAVNKAFSTFYIKCMSGLFICLSIKGNVLRGGKYMHLHTSTVLKCYFVLYLYFSCHFIPLLLHYILEVNIVLFIILHM